MEIIKESKNLGKLLFKEINYNLAKELIIKNHYSHKWNTSFGKINIGVFKFENLDDCIGVASFGNLMNPNSYKNLNDQFDSKNVIELNRLWIDDCLGKNAETILLGACWKIIRNDYKDIKAVQSFADGRLGCGTIYKASNFDYYGYTESLFYENIETGEVQHKVPMENTKRPDGMIKLNSLYCEGKLKPFIVKTYRYIYPLYKNTKIKLEKKNYPEYDKGFVYVENYEHRISLYFRSYILSYLLGYKKEKEIIEKFIKNNFTKTTIDQEYEKSLKNESIIEISKERKKENLLKEMIEKSFFDLIGTDEQEMTTQVSLFDL